jgi:hypothetical protein
MSVDSKSGCGIRWGAAVLAAVLAVAAAGGSARAQQHPLDPLTAAELAEVGSILTASGQFSPATNFAWITLDEPPKAEVAAFVSGAEFPRRASVAAIDYARQKTYAVVVDIRARRIASLTDLQGLQPGLTGESARRWSAAASGFRAVSRRPWSSSPWRSATTQASRAIAPGSCACCSRPIGARSMISARSSTR